MFFVLTIILLTLPLIWIIADPRSLQERIKAYFNPKSALYGLAEMAVIVATYLSRKYYPWPNTTLDGLIVLLGIIIFLVGMFIAVWAKITMKANWGMPGQHDITRQNKIIRKGPFSFSRNPIYLGLILVILGYTLALKSYTILLVPIAIAYFYKAVLKEEKILTKYFGKEYLEYKSKVPRFI